MFSVVIYSKNQELCEVVKNHIQDFLISIRQAGKVTNIEDEADLLVAPNNYDLYIMDMDSNKNTLDLSKRIIQIDSGSHFIFISEKKINAYKVAQIRGEYFLSIPINKNTLFEFVLDIKRKIREESVIIKIPGGERKVRTSMVNYINIEKRCLCYHLKDGTMFDGQVLRGSFEKAITPLQFNKVFYFLYPSHLINVSEIKIFKKNSIIFENDEELFLPKTSIESLRNRWVKFSTLEK